MNNQPFDLTSFFFAELPLAGKISFDYVSIARPVPGVEFSSDESINSMINKVFSVDLEKYNVANDYIDPELAAAEKRIRQEEEGMAKEAAEEEERAAAAAKAALAPPSSSPPGSPGKSGKRRMSLAMGAANLEKAEKAHREKAKEVARLAALKEGAKEGPKYETLASQTAKKKNEENLAIWADYMDTSWVKFKKAYRVRKVLSITSITSIASIASITSITSIISIISYFYTPVYLYLYPYAHVHT